MENKRSRLPDQVNNKPSEKFQKRLKMARTIRQWNQSELAEKADLPPSSIAHFEIGSRKPSFDNLRRLAIALDVTTCLVSGEDAIVYKGEKTKEKLWDKYYIQAPAQHRQPVEKYKIVKRA